MNVLKLKVQKNELSFVEADTELISKNVGYDKCMFSFDGDWNEFLKTAIFWQSEDELRLEGYLIFYCNFNIFKGVGFINPTFFHLRKWGKENILRLR